MSDETFIDCIEKQNHLPDVGQKVVPVPKEKAEETTGYCSDEESLKNQIEGVLETNAPIVEID